MIIDISTILSARTKRGMVEIRLGDQRAQMDLDKAREVLGMLTGAIEAAISDELVFRFLTEKIGMSVDDAGKSLLVFREWRQGSKESVHPS